MPFVVASPGTLTYDVYASDAAGVGTIRTQVRSSDSTLNLDTTVYEYDTVTTLQTFAWPVPPGMPTGATVTILATSEDVLALTGADSATFTVQDTSSAPHAPRHDRSKIGHL